MVTARYEFSQARAGYFAERGSISVNPGDSAFSLSDVLFASRGMTFYPGQLSAYTTQI